MNKVWKVVNVHDIDMFRSLYAGGELGNWYHVGKTIESSTPLFCFDNEATAHEYAQLESASVMPSLVLDCETPDVPMKLTDHPILRLSMIDEGIARNIQEYWDDYKKFGDLIRDSIKWKPVVWRTVQDDVVGVYTLTPQGIGGLYDPGETYHISTDMKSLVLI